MKQSGTSIRLTGAVQDLATEVVSALRGGDHLRLAESLSVRDETGPPGDLALAAVRVLGPDVLLPAVLRIVPPDPDDLAVVRKAVDAFPPSADASPTSRWSHWAMRHTLLRLDPPLDDARTDGTEPGAGWLDGVPWQFLTHQLAVLAPLALPADDSALTRAARHRPVDVARGFVLSLCV